MDEMQKEPLYKKWLFNWCKLSAFLVALSCGVRPDHAPVFERVTFLKLAVWSAAFALVSFHWKPPVFVSVALGLAAL
ncbi:hypothetical protein, partial [Vibrio crassostreae]|uniref:hypothetical protein n=1 Tax=Vibrio crassostreae TaxID=246167 RepID=UPI001B301A58